MILGVVGVALVVLAVVDQYLTTLTLQGGGPVTSRLVAGLWRPAARSRRISHRVLQRYGALMLPVILGTWLVLLYTGWTMFFLARSDAVVVASTGEPVGSLPRLYFVGYVLTTLGNGELRPGDGYGQVGTVAAALCGLALITLAITFVMPVLDAVVHKRQVARTVVGLGATSRDVLANGWDGRGFSAMTTHLANLVPELTSLAQQHVAYPVLHYFHTPDRVTALAPAISVLDEALTLIRHGVAPEHRLDAVTTRTTATAIEVLLEALDAAHIDAADRAPDPPPLSTLVELGIPTVEPAGYEAAVAGLAGRRALLLAFVASDGWTWEPQDDA